VERKDYENTARLHRAAKKRFLELEKKKRGARRVYLIVDTVSRPTINSP